VASFRGDIQQEFLPVPLVNGKKAKVQAAEGEE
jgi:hypothetical protein